MATLTAQQIQDLVAGTLRELGRMKFQQIAQSLQQYEIFSKWFKSDKVIFESGVGIQRNLMTKINSDARHVGLLENDQTNLVDVMTQMQIDWRHLTASWSMEYRTDILMNRGEALVFNVIKPRRANAMIGIVELLEAAGWGTPPSSSDQKEPWGVQYWVVPNNTQGFNGGAPAGHTTVGGVNLTDNPTFKNYTAQYAAVSKADLIKKMRTGHRSCRFVSPIGETDYRNGIRDRYRIYCNETVISSFEDVGEGQNENLGRDIDSMGGTMVFRGHPIIWVPQLDANTSNLVYMIDHSTFYPVCLKGDYLRESAATQNPNNHNVYQIFIDLTYNYLNLDRRRNAVFTL